MVLDADILELLPMILDGVELVRLLRKREFMRCVNWVLLFRCCFLWGVMLSLRILVISRLLYMFLEFQMRLSLSAGSIVSIILI